MDIWTTIGGILGIGAGLYVSFLTQSCDKQANVKYEQRCSKLYNECISQKIKPFQCKTNLHQFNCFLE